MADTQITGTLSADEPISGGLSANEGIEASLTPDEEVSGTLEVTRTRVVATMLSELEDVEINDLQDDDILVYDSLDGKWHNEANAGGGGVWGTITGTLSDQTDLQNALDDKYNRSEANVLGAKNLLPLTNLSYGGEGITWTIADDGTIVANGTAGSSENARIAVKIPSGLSGNFYFSGCPAGGSAQTYDVYPMDYTTEVRPKKWDGTTEAGTDFGGTSQEIQVPSGHDVRITCRIRAGVTVSNLTFKPMLRLPTDTDGTFAPYSMTNKELTDAVGQNVSDIDAIEALIPSSATTSNQLATASDIPVITGKADKVTSATSGDFAGLDANGNLTDSGISADIVPSSASSSNKLATANDIPSLTNYVEKSETAGLLKNDGTVDTTQYVSDISGKVDNSVVAPVENGATASRAYAIGEHFIKDGAFCTAKTAIASGATFTLNTNYIAGNIAGEFEKTPDTIHELVTNVSYTKKDGFVILSASGNTGVSITQGSWITLGTLPEGYRPTETWSTMAGIGGSVDYYGVMRVTSAGKVQVYQNLAASSSVVYGNLTYPI